MEYRQTSTSQAVNSVQPLPLLYNGRTWLSTCTPICLSFVFLPMHLMILLLKLMFVWLVSSTLWFMLNVEFIYTSMHMYDALYIGLSIAAATWTVDQKVYDILVNVYHDNKGTCLCDDTFVSNTGLVLYGIVIELKMLKYF